MARIRIKAHTDLIESTHHVCECESWPIFDLLLDVIDRACQERGKRARIAVSVDGGIGSADEAGAVVDRVKDGRHGWDG